MKFRGRQAAQVENEHVRITITKEGGHIAEILEKKSGVNPLWTPPWETIEPSAYDPAKHLEYGLNSESKLLAGIMGHNLCLDIFGPPSEKEAAAGLTVHGESSVVPYEIEIHGDAIQASATLPLAGLSIKRGIRLVGKTLYVRETVENLTALDRPIAWTQHVTLGPPFIENGVTQIAHNSTRSQVHGDMGGAPDRKVFSNEAQSAGFATHLMDQDATEAYFTAFNPNLKVSLSYRWKRHDFPWLGIWEENRKRETPPWNSRTITWGMEFGASPFPETRRDMIMRGHLFDVPAFRWLEAGSQATVEYRAEISAT